MKLAVQIKLLPSPEQANALRKTLVTANSAANRLSELGWKVKEFHQLPLQKAFYRQLRDEFPTLSSQAIVRLIAKVGEAYKLDHECQRIFRHFGSISYDARILSFQLTNSTVSIWAVGGRIKALPFVCGEAQRRLLELPKGESDLILCDGKWYLNVSVEVPEPQEQQVTEWLGVDMGVVEIASTSDGQKFSGKVLNNIRLRHRRIRSRLQKIGSRASRRKLLKRKRRESRFAKDLNHRISKQIVAVAERTKRGIAVEKLTGIRSRIRARKGQGARLHSWSFAQLGSFLRYKAKRAGVPFKEVDPRNTSRQCSSCGFVAKTNRKSQACFACAACGHTENADINASRNIAGRAAVNQPIESEPSKIRHVAGLGSRSNSCAS